jgi:hypothetical protein
LILALFGYISQMKKKKACLVCAPLLMYITSRIVSKLFPNGIVKFIKNS